jgi:hypothetical protein
MLMNNQQNPAGPPSGAPNPYDFLNESAPHKKSLLPSPSSKNGMIIMFFGGLGLLSIIAIIIFSVIGNIGSDIKADWLSVTKQQQELIRLSEVGSKNASSPEAKNLATNVGITLKASQPSINNLSSKSGAKFNEKSLAAVKNEQTDTRLEAAEQNGQFDATFTAVIREQLVEYQVLLKRLDESSKNKSTLEIISSAYDNAQLLATQAK